MVRRPVIELLSALGTAVAVTVDIAIDNRTDGFHPTDDADVFCHRKVVLHLSTIDLPAGAGGLFGRIILVA